MRQARILNEPGEALDAVDQPPQATATRWPPPTEQFEDDLAQTGGLRLTQARMHALYEGLCFIVGQ